MTDIPKVSVVLPTFNSEGFIKASVESILCQTFSDFELLVIDDGSTDNTALIIRSIQNIDHRVKYIQLPHSGIVDALNVGLYQAAGEYIARMDADDIALPERLERQAQYLDCNSDCVIVSNAIGVIDERNRFLGYFTEEHRGPFSPGDDATSKVLDIGTFLLHPTVMYRKQTALKLGGYRKEYEWIEDADFYNRIVKEGSAVCLPTVLLHYRVHLSSVTRSKGQLQEALKAKLATEMAGVSLISQVDIVSPSEQEFIDPQVEQQRRIGFLTNWSYLSSRHSGNIVTSLSLVLEALAIDPTHKASWITLLLVLFGDDFVAGLVSIRRKLVTALS